MYLGIVDQSGPDNCANKTWRRESEHRRKATGIAATDSRHGGVGLALIDQSPGTESPQIGLRGNMAYLYIQSYIEKYKGTSCKTRDVESRLLV